MRIFYLYLGYIYLFYFRYINKDRIKNIWSKIEIYYSKLRLFLHLFMIANSPFGMNVVIIGGFVVEQLIYLFDE